MASKAPIEQSISFAVSPQQESAHFCMVEAQELNNIATIYIESGKYESATAALQEALRLWEEHRVRQLLSKSQSSFCTCCQCTLDACISFSEQQNNYLANQNKGGKCCSNNNSNIGGNQENGDTRNRSISGWGNKRRRISSHKGIALKEQDQIFDDTAATNYKRKNRLISRTPFYQGYIYQNPILIPKHHNMGATCFFIIMFNLTLANHLKVLNAVDTKTDDIQGVLNLYELVFEYWSRLQTQSNIQRVNDTPVNNSLRFVMILFNNMSQMYKMVDNSIKQKQCLENLMSMVMIAVEWNTRLAVARQNIHDEGGICSSETFQQSIDGFLTNLMPPQHCAEAA